MTTFSKAKVQCPIFDSTLQHKQGDYALHLQMWKYTSLCVTKSGKIFFYKEKKKMVVWLR